ncbi:CDP-glycerol glycerophosphotransferase family protein [Actinomyces ruminicola]|uniref:CDP-glycerol glycerophosphotransferase, TagB/SpsB family n=1 Tax=Actinomyces ruminicola TaxID=332524 RepID=A0A1G9YB69_9ACTO|nr:CDP-glycerol glycerophosphotransferase family protein [Actinomyces ruminicola]SDN06260.1 CDP-glycerol glycerophosphotransferase, TagB/SpsB family [Actinomyces ruminicola]
MISITPRVVVIVDGGGDLETTLIGLADEGISDVVVCVGREGPTPAEAAALAEHGLEPVAGETALDAARTVLASLRGGRVLVLRAGDVPEPGLVEELPTSGSAAVVMVPLKRMVDGHVSDTHPLRARFPHGSRDTSLSAEPHLFTQRLSGAVMEVPAGGLPPWDEDDADGTTLLIRLLTDTGQRVRLHAGPGIIERPRPEDPPPLSTLPEYTQVLERDIPAWYSAAREGGRTPSWVHQLVLARLLDVTDADRGLRFAAHALSQTERARVAELLVGVLARVPADQVEAYCATPVALNRQAALLAATGALLPDPVLPSERSFRADRQVSYFFTGSLPDEQWYVDGETVEPTSTKIVDHTYFDRVFVHERLVWLPKGSVTAVIGGREATPAAYRGMRRPPAPLPGPGNRVRRAVTRRARALRRRASRLLGRAGTTERTRLAVRTPPEEAPAVALDVPSTWLYMDRHDSAGDNAEPLYRYAREHATGIRHVFAVDRRCADWERLEAEGFELVSPGTAAFEDAWTQADTLLLADIGDPAIAGRLMGAGTRKDQRVVFLQHGVTMRHMWRWFNTRRIDVLITAHRAEYAAITADHSPYLLTDREVWLTGFPRHDAMFALLGRERDRVVLAPTWSPTLSRTLDREPTRTDLLDAFCEPWLQLARVLGEAGADVVLFAHPKLALTVPEWFRELPVPTTTGTDVPEQLSRAWAVVSDRSSILDDAMLLGAVAIVWSPDGTADADAYRRMHVASGAVSAASTGQALAAAVDARDGRLQPASELIISDAGACGRILSRLEKETI